MSLTDKVIKNTFYLFIAQILGFLTPFLLTPIIISYIGDIQFGIYALVLGFIGSFGLLDLSISTSFVRFISEHYNKKEERELNSVINTGLFFYVVFSLVITILGILYSEWLISLINVPADLIDTAVLALRIGLLIFFIATSTNIYISILVSLQKMYWNSIIGIFINLLNVGGILFLLSIGMGLKGILYSNLVTVIISAIVSIILAKKALPEMRFGFGFFNTGSLKKMSSFGLQMQVSKLAGFATEKYDEFLLGYFSALNNVTYFNLAMRVTRLGKFIPLQLFQQVAPVAAELNAKGETQKLKHLFAQTTRYLTITSLPVFVFILFFAELIIESWVGPGYELASYIIRFLVVSQLINLAISAPGNAIIPNLGKPKYLMMEGLIGLGINLILSFILIMNYGVVGAAIGNAAATIIASVYVYFKSVNYFKEEKSKFLFTSYPKPLLISAIAGGISFAAYLGILQLGISADRIINITYLAGCFAIFGGVYTLLILKSGYLNDEDKVNIKKLVNHFLPAKVRLR